MHILSIDIDCVVNEIHKYLRLHIYHSIQLNTSNDIYIAMTIKKHSLINKSCLYGVWHVVKYNVVGIF